MKRLNGKFVISCKNCGIMSAEKWQNNGTINLTKDDEIVITCSACGHTEILFGKW